MALEIADFESNTAEGFSNLSAIAGGANGTDYAGRITNATDGDVESTKGMTTGFPVGFDTVKFYVKLPASNVIVSGDASAIVITDSGGWKWVSLYNWCDREDTNWQLVTIPLAKFGSNGDGTPVSDPTGSPLVPEDADGFKFRFWNSVSRNWDFDEVQLVSSFALEQHSFRFYDDDGDEDASTPLEALNTPVTVQVETPVRLRVLVNATGDPSSKNFKLQYRKVGDTLWQDVEEAT